MRRWTRAKQGAGGAPIRVFAIADIASNFLSRMQCAGRVLARRGIRCDIVHRWPLLSSIFRVAYYEFRVEKTGQLLRLSTNRSNFLLLHKTGSAGQPGRVPLIETSDSQREQRLENTAGGVGLPISTFPNIS
ncbi:hypothetical protein ALC53_10136 [Atta colombica]|uniref:Uncharacterized protein n=1 Tax=Atta colombica TaxID=520822 RepID=A0A195B4I1_9HYME|nr:hypothetical protein ALC53_10136 [Atta colombica]